MYSLWRQGRYPLQRPHLPHLHIAQEQHRPDIAMMQILTKSVFLFFSTCWNCFCACVYKSLAEEVFTIVFKSTSRASINEPWKLFSFIEPKSDHCLALSVGFWVSARCETWMMLPSRMKIQRLSGNLSFHFERKIHFVDAGTKRKPCCRGQDKTKAKLRFYQCFD